MKSLLIFYYFLSSAYSASKEEWRGKAIYQLFTDRFYRTDGSTAPCNDLRSYCGGTFKGIQSQLDYIANLGFDAIWISPIPENMESDPFGYSGYNTLDWYRCNPHFGTE